MSGGWRKWAAALVLAAGFASADASPSGDGLQAAEAAPTTVEALWAGFDPRKDPLEDQTVRSWEKDGVVYRYVTFRIGDFKGKPARAAAYFGFPKGAEKRPGLLHLHGGGQRAFLREVEFYAARGYACLSLNWGGREMEDARPGEPNTDWGAVDPTQKNVPGYNNLKPGPLTVDAFESPRNNNWYLLALAARRGLTFLERQPEVDADRLGVYGHSMGGNLTVYVAGVDPRVKVAAPSVGGSGFRTEPRPLLPEETGQRPNGDLAMFRGALEFQAYAARIRAPLLWLGSTNDFHGVMDDTYRTGALIPHDSVRYAFAPHLNHLFTPEFEVVRPLWLDQHLQGGLALPPTPDSKLVLAAGRPPELRVVPDASLPVAEVHLYYSIDPDPRARFWRSADAVREGSTWSAPLPILSTQQHLFAFANVLYALPEKTASRSKPAVAKFGLSSLLHTAPAAELQKADVKATDAAAAVVEDFAHGWRDWYQLSADNPHHWEYATRKISDPKWRGEDGRRLTFVVQADRPNPLVVVLSENLFRPYRGAAQDYFAVAQLVGGDAPQTVTFALSDFKTSEGAPLTSWGRIDLLRLRAYVEQGGRLLYGGKQWAGPQPKISLIRWDAAPR